jgi:hypothetical protein
MRRMGEGRGGGACVRVAWVGILAGKMVHVVGSHTEGAALS